MTNLDRAPYGANRVTKLEPKRNGRNLAGEKELIATLHFVAPLPKGHYSGKKLDAVITVRCWMGRSRNASTVYASIWARSRDGAVSIAGHGHNGGYGYHKQSAAINEAFRSAGVTMQAPFDGCGDSAIEVAVRALAKALGWKSGELI